jgi:hypothetical protein
MHGLVKGQPRVVVEIIRDDLNFRTAGENATAYY